ncbi:dihydrolipoyl dehydrogenase [Komagataeibacter melaceti]|uniref:Dihydrolipoyl dehydrogenase n=1 Tax=Komagataeibacter melaceti TaxID=2766577 RepID=A0A371Z1P2_9PROT|nr:dihydrolipoyl dehydrogenase [Komagataeibacter melaceti]RFD20398.1 dihydrolipoyl dehydrogenase [Komagataeibacter melaceti]
MSTTQFDVIIIGGGPGGYVAAIRAAQLGLKTAVVEAAQLGGICLNWGCIPTKALLRASEINHLLHDLDGFGFAADNIRFDFARVIKRSRDVSAQLSAGVSHLLKKHKVTVINGFGKLAGTQGGLRKVSVSRDGAETAALTAPHVIVATGARARVLPGLEPDGRLIWSYREAMTPTALPRSLLVIGSGAIGVEFASFYRNMGAEVTIVEVADRILPVEDAEISTFARKALEKQGMKILTGAKLGTIAKGDNSVTVDVTAGGKTQQVTVERVISAVGIVGNVENIGLEGTAIEVAGTHIKVDPYCRTGEKGVYAIGDIAAPPWLAHKASHEGVMVAEMIAGRTVHPISPLNIPGCTYCRPQVASVGLTEARAKEAGYKLRIGRFPFIGNGKAIAMGEPEGLVKTIFDAETGELLGAHMVGAEVTEMIQGYVIARTGELTEAELKETVFPHPTISETMHEAVLAAYDGALHI